MKGDVIFDPCHCDGVGCKCGTHALHRACTFIPHAEMDCFIQSSLLLNEMADLKLVVFYDLFYIKTATPVHLLKTSSGSSSHKGSIVSSLSGSGSSEEEEHIHFTLPLPSLLTSTLHQHLHLHLPHFLIPSSAQTSNSRQSSKISSSSVVILFTS